MGLRGPPFQQSIGSDHLQYPTQIDTDQLGKLEQYLTGTATPRRQPCTLSAVGQEPVQNLQHVTCNVAELWYLANKACRRAVKAGQGHAVKAGQSHRWQANIER